MRVRNNNRFYKRAWGYGSNRGALKMLKLLFISLFMNLASIGIIIVLSILLDKSQKKKREYLEEMIDDAAKLDCMLRNLIHSDPEKYHLLSNNKEIKRIIDKCGYQHHYLFTVAREKKMGTYINRGKPVRFERN